MKVVVPILDCSQSPIFPLDRRCRSLSPTGRHLGLLMRAKLGRVQNAHGKGWWMSQQVGFGATANQIN